jgi:hypothetical protein
MVQSAIELILLFGPSFFDWNGLRFVISGEVREGIKSEKPASFWRETVIRDRS